MRSKQEKAATELFDYVAAVNGRESVKQLTSFWHLVWVNFFIGIIRGIGFIFGTTIVVGLLIYFLAMFLKGLGGLPFIGQQIDVFIRNIISQINITLPLNF